MPKFDIKPPSFWNFTTPSTKFTCPKKTSSTTTTRRLTPPMPLKKHETLTAKVHKELDDLSKKWEERPRTINNIWSAVKTTAIVTVGVCKALGWPFVGYLVMEALQR
ncbi:hypothetical protein ABW21_db0206362 [Orbilia brochopaga]|nr:hypothetical protein ABW21_db0206362 [Drechslerella brochopaga]